MPDGNASYIGPIDVQAMTPNEREALKQRIIRRARVERVQAIRAMFARLLGRLQPIRRIYHRISGWKPPVTAPKGTTEA